MKLICTLVVFTWLESDGALGPPGTMPLNSAWVAPTFKTSTTTDRVQLGGFRHAMDDMLYRSPRGRTVSTTASPLWEMVNNSVAGVAPQRRVDDKGYDALFAELRDSRGLRIGETYIMKREGTGRIINLNIMSTGDQVLIVSDTTWSRGGSDEYVNVAIVPRSAPDFMDKEEAAMEAMKEHPLYREPSADGRWKDDIEVADGEKDSDGRYVLDGLFIMSKNAEYYSMSYLGMTPEEYIDLNILLVTTAWRNSEIDNVKLRRVSIQIWQPDPTVSPDNTYWVRDVAVPYMDAVGADFVAYFTMGTENGDTWAEALAGVSDDYSLAMAQHYINWRHEFGHNGGNIHCWEEGGGFNFGWELESLPDTPGTIMCGNGISMYSNPEISVQGIPAGDAEKADATRTWRDSIPAFSGSRKHLIPFEGDLPEYTLEGTMSKTNPRDNIIAWNVIANTRRMIVKTKGTNVVDYDARHAVFVHSDCCPGVYYGQDLFVSAHYLDIPCPQEGNWLAYISGIGPTNFTIEMYM
eukprot:Protomagalhaensia_wolfi_Nauph_80__6171@NODE_908_length_1894_cov_1202_366038_g649_i1_p1_GENE_NODE_908_length_1894_cov_1202_366038_g649_i1NODE_908_length_1894_cov_1202_366038_g649_i1_p1_ORF_typecomplete_len521_score87_71Reprolysin_4/PF13583_6/0_062Reprolysin_3/PF13582_6/1_8e04Reprolysin_3/PF13582_6/0_23Reprolysin_5/PF13688_6/0_23_NODE_908_length_1894_cov_1202_366038_g649_i12901852